jgi:DNA-binding CsgD family transcriptional regulator
MATQASNNCPYNIASFVYPDMQPDPSVHRLSPRQYAVVLLVADGLTPLQIARRLTLSPNTVTTYLQSIKRRLHLDTQDDIASWVAARRLPGCPHTLRRAADQHAPSSWHRQQPGQRRRHDDQR